MRSNFNPWKRFLNAGEPMPRIFWALGVVVVLFAIVVGGMTGCSESVPPLNSYPSPNSQINQDAVAFFDTGANGSVTINPDLFESNNPPTYLMRTPGSVTMVNNFPAYVYDEPAYTWPSPTKTQGVTFITAQGVSLITSFLMSPILDQPGADGTPFAFHVTGMVNDPGDYSTFPELDADAYLEGGAFYDATYFANGGVQFYYKTANDDTATHRTFQIPVYQTSSLLTGGDCSDGPRLCDDNFALDLSDGTGGQWKLIQVKLTDLHQLYVGVQPNPPNLTGINLQQILFLKWGEGRNNQPGLCTVDFWVDNVQFYQ